MVAITIQTFDRVKYGVVPQLSAYGLLRLIRDLERAMPANAPDIVGKSATRMLTTAEALRAGVEERVEEGGETTGFAFAFDVLLDRLWTDGENELEHRTHYADPVLATMSKERRDAIDLEHRVEVAATARELKGLLFSEGRGFLQLGMPIQAEQMAVRLDIIKKSPKAELYAEVLGEGLLNTLNTLQGHYDDLVHGRVMQQKTSSVVRELRYTAQRHATVYASAVMLMLDDDDETTLDVVIAALTPIANARDQRDQPQSEKVEESEPVDQAPPNVDDVEKTQAD